MRLLAKLFLPALLCLCAVPASAVTDEEKTSQACEKIYAELCKDVAKGQDRLVLCAAKHQDLAIPDKCQADYQQKFEGIVDVETQECVTKARPLCKSVKKALEGVEFLTACGKANPAVFSKLMPVCKAIAGE